MQHSDISSDEEDTDPLKERQAIFQASDGRKEAMKREITSEMEVRSEQNTTTVNSNRDSRTFSLQPYESTQGQLGYGWMGSRERVAHEGHSDNREGHSGNGNSGNLEKDLPHFYMSQDTRNFYSGRPETLHMRVTASSRSQDSDKTSSPESEGISQLMSVKSFDKNMSPHPESEQVIKKKMEKPALYQETSLCGGSSSVMRQQDRSQVLRQNMDHTSASTPYNYFSLTSSQSKSGLKPGQNFCSSLSPIDSDSEGAFHQLLPIFKNRQGNDSPNCEAASIATSHHSHSDGDDDTESEVWVLREDFKNANCTETNADVIRVSTNKQQPKLHKASTVPQTQPSPEHNTTVLSTSCAKPTHPLGSKGQNSRLVLKRARIMIAEWCIIAKVMDRILFILCLIATLFAYIFILIVVPLEFGSRTGNVTFVNTVNTGRYMWQQS